jgi:hypothetical protein
MVLQRFLGPWPLLQFLNLLLHSRLNYLNGRSASSKAVTCTQNKRTQTLMPLVRFELTTPTFERTKTVRALDRAATVIGYLFVPRPLIACSVNVLLIIVAARSKAWNAFARSNVEIVSSNHTQVMNDCVCVYSMFMLSCVGSGLATGWALVQGVLPAV